MTRRQRMWAIFDGRVPDRPAVKLWGADWRRELLHPDFAPVRDLALAKTDLLIGSGAPFSVYCGRYAGDLIETREEPTESPEWVHAVTVFHTPRGDLREVYTRSTCRKPGYVAEQLLKEPGDIRRLLSMPYQPYPFSDEDYRREDKRVGDAGLALFGLDHAMYALQRKIGSENFALWSLEADERLMEGIRVFAGRIADHARAALAAGIRGVFGWCGPELCIPPLMSPAAFDRYVLDFDKPIIDLLHEGGARVWVHCHGRMGPVLERFAEMGADVLNPIEPPPMGDVTMAQAFARVGNRMGLEGGIETHDFLAGTTADLRARIRQNLDAGRGRRFILCPSSGYMENTEPSRREIENWLFYIEEGVRVAESMRE